MAGLNADGLTILRQPEVLQNIETSERANIDKNINTQDNELLGQLNNIMSENIADLWGLAQAVYDNFDLREAEGNSLDSLGIIAGRVLRKSAVKSSTSRQLVTASPNSNLPVNSILSNLTTGDRVFTSITTTLEPTSCRSAVVEVTTLANSTLYRITVNSTDYDYTSDASATVPEILEGLRSTIAADTSATWTAEVSNDSIRITTDNDSDNISVTLLANMQVVTVDVFVTAAAENTGPLIFPANSVTNIVVGIVGVQSTTNTEAYSLGRELETDEDYRTRIAVSQQSGGSATIESIRDGLRNVAGTTSVKVTENNTLSTVDTIPPKAFEAVVLGGTDEDVGLSIWNTKPAGIQSFGSTSHVIQDSDGNNQTINFTRPALINTAFRITYTLYDEEVFPSTGEADMKQAIKSAMDVLSVGEDIIPTRFLGPIYSGVAGIDSLLVEAQVLPSQGDTPNPSNWSTDRIDISDRQLPFTIVSDMYTVGP